MHPILRSSFALSLVASSLVFAQDLSNKNDMSGVEQASAGTSQPIATPSFTPRNRINNAGADVNTGVRQQPGAFRDAQLQPGALSAQQQVQLQQLQLQQQLQQLQQLQQRPPVTSEFQKFVSETLGKTLPVFGAEFFSNAPSTFAPVQNTPVPADYPLGPGDEVLIRGWGTIDIDYRATIDRNGLVNIPTVGSVVLGGVKAGDAEGVVQQAVSKLYKGVNLNVNFGQLRAITVYVVGQANRPGTYTVSSLSTLVTALFASGGPNANGSMRRVEVKRGGKVAATLDLYDFIAKGDRSADIKLRDGDTIFIPAASGFVALTGKVNTPAIYELRDGRDTVQTMLDFAGGLPVVADPRRAYLERVEPGKNQPRSVEQLTLDGAGLSRNLKNGDVLNVVAITPDFANAVVLRGNVEQPLRAAFKPGMRVSDLITSRQMLVTRSALQRQNAVVKVEESDALQDRRTALQQQNNALGITGTKAPGALDEDAEETPVAARIGAMMDEVNWEYAVIERVNPADLSVSLIPFNLGHMFENPNGVDNVELQPGDTVTVFSQRDMAVPIDKRRVFVRIEGEVNVPGVYQMSPGDNLQALIAKAGGPTGNAYLFGSAFYREQVRKEQLVNQEKAATRLESQLRSEQSRVLANVRSTSAADAQLAEARRQADMQTARETIARFRQMKPSGRIAFGLSPDMHSLDQMPKLKLENGDRLVVPARPDFVHVFGSVNTESSVLWRPGMTVNDYLNKAGMTPEADADNVFVIRVDGSIASGSGTSWYSRGIGGLEVVPGDNIVVPEKIDKETAWSRFTVGLREWSQILANLGLGAAAIKTLK